MVPDRLSEVLHGNILYVLDFGILVAPTEATDVLAGTRRRPIDYNYLSCIIRRGFSILIYLHYISVYYHQLIELVVDMFYKIGHLSAYSLFVSQAKGFEAIDLLYSHRTRSTMCTMLNFEV